MRQSRRSQAKRNLKARTEAARVKRARAGDDPADVSVVLVHGVGDQADGSVLKSWGASMATSIGVVLEAQGWKLAHDVASRLQLNDLTVPTRRLTFTRPGHPERAVEFIEGAWAQHYRQPSLLRTLPWVLQVLPAAVLLFLPDQRDRALLTWDGDTPPGLMIAGPTLRFAGRLLSAAGLLTLALTVREVGVAMVALAGAMVVWMLVSRGNNLAGHVSVAATDSAELQRIRKRLSQVVRVAQDRAHETVVVAHSQGGFLTRVCSLNTLPVSRPIVRQGARPVTQDSGRLHNLLPRSSGSDQV